MEPDKLKELAQFAIGNAGNLLAIVIPAVLSVAGFIIWLYETFRVPPAKELNERLTNELDDLRQSSKGSIANLTERVDRLRKARDAIKEDLDELTVRNAEAARSLAGSQRAGRSTYSTCPRLMRVPLHEFEPRLRRGKTLKAPCW